MGASNWRNYTPFRENPEEALQQLRRDVFARGEYSFGCGGFDRPNGFGAIPPETTQLINSFAQMPGTEGRIARAAMSGDFTGLSDAEQEAARQIRPLFQMTQGGGFGQETDGGEDDADDEQPESIEDLLEMVAEDGTHSILDIEHTGNHLGFGVAIPFPQDRIVELFGTDRPTHEQVEARWDGVAEELERWQAYYLIVFRDGEPHEYAFIGCSGD